MKKIFRGRIIGTELKGARAASGREELFVSAFCPFLHPGHFYSLWTVEVNSLEDSIKPNIALW